MSKKRKTRKQKEKALERRVTIAQSPINDTATYKIEQSPNVKALKNKVANDIKIESTEKSYLKQDIMKIATASGVVFAADLVLYLLLSRDLINLPLFGY